MKKGFSIFCLVMLFFVQTNTTFANRQNDILPCSLLLNPLEDTQTNSKGVALVYMVKHRVTEESTRDRTSISIHALHLPEPSSLGNYDSYEGFAFVPDIISWRFRLPASETNGPIWTGKFDEISVGVNDAIVQVRLSNSKTNSLGPPVLEGSMANCQR